MAVAILRSKATFLVSPPRSGLYWADEAQRRRRSLGTSPVKGRMTIIDDFHEWPMITNYGASDSCKHLQKCDGG